MEPRILIVNVNWLGDVLFSTPSIRAIRKNYPKAFIACLAPPRCAGLLKNNPNINEIIETEDKIPFYSVPGHWSVISKLKRRRFDKAIFFHRSRTKAFWAWAAAIPERIGYQGLGRQKFLTRICAEPVTPVHKTDYFLKLLGELNISPDGREPDFFAAAGTEKELKRLFEDYGIPGDAPYVVVHAGGNWPLKRWPAGYFIQWIQLFLARYPWKVILCGTASEETLSREISGHFNNERVISFCGKTSIDALALLLKNSQLVITNDSGPIHIAASQGARIVGLFGPTSPELTGPIARGPALILKKDVGCEIPCYYRECDARLCMEWLRPEEVFKKTVEFLNQP